MVNIRKKDKKLYQAINFNLPRPIYSAFKAICFSQHISMAEAMVQFVVQYVDNAEQIFNILEKDRKEELKKAVKAYNEQKIDVHYEEILHDDKSE